VTHTTSRITETLPRDWNEPPLVACRKESELQDSEGAGVPHLTIGYRIAEGSGVSTASAGDELANSTLRIRAAVGILRCEPLIIMIVAVDHHVGIGPIQGLPERFHLGITAVLSGTEQRMMPIREGTCSRMCGEVLA
jgi:hypothetical protein